MTAPASVPRVAIAIVGICGPTHLARCLQALRDQESAPPVRIVVCHDPQLYGMEAVASRYPEARIFSNPDERTPFEMAAAAIRESDGDVVLVTEDHCVPAPDWVRRMLAARAPGRAAVGGRVEAAPAVTAIDWAFYFVDFFRYAAPVESGPASSLSICNVAYEREQLLAVREVWHPKFQETDVNEALRARFGALWMEPLSVVAMHRSVALRDALYERYAFGRQFARTRASQVGTAKRWLYAALAPALPVVLLARMAAKAMRARALAGPFLRALVPLTAMVVSWSWGEWLGYVTARPPRSNVVAAERGTDRDSAHGMTPR